MRRAGVARGESVGRDAPDPDHPNGPREIRPRVRAPSPHGSQSDDVASRNHPRRSRTRRSRRVDRDLAPSTPVTIPKPSTAHGRIASPRVAMPSNETCAVNGFACRSTTKRPTSAIGPGCRIRTKERKAAQRSLAAPESGTKRSQRNVPSSRRLMMVLVKNHEPTLPAYTSLARTRSRRRARRHRPVRVPSRMILSAPLGQGGRVMPGKARS